MSSKREGKGYGLPLGFAAPKPSRSQKRVTGFAAPKPIRSKKGGGANSGEKQGGRGFASPKTPVSQPRNRAPSQNNPPPTSQPRNQSNTKSPTKPQPRNHHNQPPKRGHILGVRLGAGLVLLVVGAAVFGKHDNGGCVDAFKGVYVVEVVE